MGVLEGDEIPQQGGGSIHETSRASQVPRNSSSRPQSLAGNLLASSASSTCRGGEDRDSKSVPSPSPCERQHSADAAAERPEGPGLRKVRAFIQKIKPKETEGQPGLSWQEVQLEPTPTLLPELRCVSYVHVHVHLHVRVRRAREQQSKRTVCFCKRWSSPRLCMCTAQPAPLRGTQHNTIVRTVGLRRNTGLTAW